MLIKTLLDTRKPFVLLGIDQQEYVYIPTGPDTAVVIGGGYATLEHKIHDNYDVPDEFILDYFEEETTIKQMSFKEFTGQWFRDFGTHTLFTKEDIQWISINMVALNDAATGEWVTVRAGDSRCSCDFHTVILRVGCVCGGV